MHTFMIRNLKTPINYYTQISRQQVQPILPDMHNRITLLQEIKRQSSNAGKSFYLKFQKAYWHGF